MFQIFTRTMSSDGWGRPYNIGHCETVEQAREYCAHAGEWESGWRYHPGKGWRGPAGRAYEFQDVGTRYTGQKLRADWSLICYRVDGQPQRALGLADLDLAGASVVTRGDKTWVFRDGVWRETKAKKYLAAAA
jgi:hypothetical protein